MTLTKDQLIELTGKTRSNAQARELDHLGIKYLRRRDGSVVVYADAVNGRKLSTPAVPELQL
jgi:hypothetical protein